VFSLDTHPLKRGTSVTILTRKFYVSKDVTFVESTPFFGSSQASPQGETLVQGDHPSSDSPSCDSDIFFPSIQPILTSSQPPGHPIISPQSPNSSHESDLNQV